MNLVILQAPVLVEHHNRFEVVLYLFIFGCIFTLIGYLCYRPYYKNKPIYEVKRENKWDYLKDGYKIMSHYRALGLLVIGIMGLFISLVNLFIYIFE